MNPIKYIIGLGNPEPKYDQTPHNIGRELVNFLAQEAGSSWRSATHYDSAKTDSFVLVRPRTYMNLSGQAVQELLHFFKAGPENILVCVDDFDIPLGQLRIRKKGSAGTHNGLKSIIQYLGTPEFARLRLGVGPIPPGSSAAHYVLSPYSKTARAQADTLLKRAQEALDTLYKYNIDIAMNSFNTRG